jgi:hypothetical protein
VVLAGGAGVLDDRAAGLLLAVLAAVGFGIAALRVQRPEEPVAAAAAVLAGLVAVGYGAGSSAWGQVGVELAVAGAAAAAYGVVAGRRWIGRLAVADLVLAAWVATAGAAVTTPEAYTLPAAAGLLLVAVPRLRARAASWAAEGAAVAVALAPSAVVAVAAPSLLRVVLVLAVGVVLTVGGALLHRQAPFVVGAISLVFTVVGRAAPYAPLAPRWVLLTLGGALLLAVGATYERRRQQAREAVAWVSGMR